MKELVEKGINFINGGKEYVRREKLQARKERKVQERRDKEKKIKGKFFFLD